MNELINTFATFDTGLFIVMFGTFYDAPVRSGEFLSMQLCSSRPIIVLNTRETPILDTVLNERRSSLSSLRCRRSDIISQTPVRTTQHVRFLAGWDGM